MYSICVFSALLGFSLHASMACEAHDLMGNRKKKATHRLVSLLSIHLEKKDVYQITFKFSGVQ